MERKRHFDCMHKANKRWIHIMLIKLITCSHKLASSLTAWSGYYWKMGPFSCTLWRVYKCVWLSMLQNAKRCFWEDKLHFDIVHGQKVSPISRTWLIFLFVTLTTFFCLILDCFEFEWMHIFCWHKNPFNTCVRFFFSLKIIWFLCLFVCLIKQFWTKWIDKWKQKKASVCPPNWRLLLIWFRFINQINDSGWFNRLLWNCRYIFRHQCRFCIQV